jgi:two-component system CheB/CheR fusion protein
MEETRSNGDDKAGVARRRPPSLVVGIGASAGGLAAFRSFFDNTPADTGMAFVLVQHLDPAQNSMLVELLQSHTQMRVEEARDQTALAANHVFVIPPNATLTLEGDVLRVSVPAPARESPAD